MPGVEKVNRRPLDPGAELARVVMQPPPHPVAAVARALAAVDDPARVAERLSFHGAWGHAHRLTSSLGLPVPTWLAEEGAGRRAWALEQHLRTLHDLDVLRSVLDAAGVPWLVIKGPTLSALYPHPDLRGYTDLDVLVPPGALREAVAALLEAGWPFVEARVDLERRPPVGELHLRGPAGTPVDLHWHLFYRADHPTRGRLDTGALVAARQHTLIGRNLVATLPVAEHLVYVCAHAAADGGNRLRSLADVAQLASRASATDWSGVVGTAEAWRVPEVVSLVLWRASRHVGAPVPPWVVARLAGRRARALAALVELVDPLPASHEHGSATATLARTGGGPLIPAGAALRRRVRQHRTRPTEWPRHDVTTLPGGVASLGRYVDAVTGEAGAVGAPAVPGASPARDGSSRP